MDDWGWLRRVCHPSHLLSFAFLDFSIAPHLHLIYSLRFTLISCRRLKTPGGGHSLIWPIRERAAGQGMVFGLLCPEQGIQFYANLS